MSNATDWADTDVLPTGFQNSSYDSRLETRVAPWKPEPRRGSLRDALATCFRDRRRILIAFLVPFIGTLVLSTIPTPKYTSDASLLLRLGREYTYTPETGSGSASPMAYDRDQTMRAEVEIFSSRDVQEAALRKIGIAKVFPSLAGESDPVKQRDLAMLELRRNLDASLPKDSNVLKLTYTSPDSAMSARVLDTLIATYLDRRRAIFNTTSTAEPQAHVESLRGRLAEAEGKLDALKKSRNIQSFAEQQSLLLAQRQSIELKLDDSSLALAQSTGRASALKSSLDTTPADVVLSNETQRSEAVENARKTLLDLTLKERDLSSKFSDTYPGVIDVRADIARTQAFLRDLESNPNRLVKTGRSTVRDGVETDLVRSLADERQAAASRSALIKQRDEVVARLDRLAASQRQLDTLERDRKLLEGALETATRRLEDERVNQQLDQSRKSNVSVMQPAREPLQSRSIRGMVLAVGTVFSVICALLVAFVSSMWRDTFVSPADVERSLGLPLLAAVPKGSLT